MAGQVDAIVTDTTLALTQAKASNGVVHVPGQFRVDQGYGVITPRGSVNTQPVDTVIGSLASDGTLKSSRLHTFNRGSALTHPRYLSGAYVDEHRE